MPERDLASVTGDVHSVETFGTVDGPGTRLVVFCQGCPMRCAYCHNPDTWSFGGGERMTVGQALDLFDRNRPFYRRGGITVSGGEPLAQPEFVGALFEAAHADSGGRIHTCLDTSGGAWDKARPERYERLLSHTDLVLLDIKHSDPEGHRALTGRDQGVVLSFGDELSRRGIPVVIRHVLVPGITDAIAELEGVGRIISRWDNVCGLDALPYHTMGVHKYEELGMAYRLEGMAAMDPGRVPALRDVILRARAMERS
ncbi:MAG: pyruvate formate-lyase-activating protein [Atopobiaceae bacterium]